MPVNFPKSGHTHAYTSLSYDNFAFANGVSPVPMNAKNARSRSYSE